MNRRETLGLAALFAVVVISQVLLVKHGEPQATWLYCHMLEWCHAK